MQSPALDLFDEIWCIDSPPKCSTGELTLAAREQRTGTFVVTRIGKTLGRPNVPWHRATSPLVVCFAAEALLAALKRWGLILADTAIVDLWVELRNQTNGRVRALPRSLAEVLACVGLDWLDVVRADAALDHVSTRHIALNARASALARLFDYVAEELSLPHALLRGRYVQAIGEVETVGIPFDAETHATLVAHRGTLAPEIGLQCEAAVALRVDKDERHRVSFRPFHARTGRNQPSQFIFGAASWLRALVRPAPGFGLAYIDWSQQEFGIAAALSGDREMRQAYESGDAYLEFAKQARAVPLGATRSSHADTRTRFKEVALGVQNGIGEAKLAEILGAPRADAVALLGLHRRTYPSYWRWSEGVIDYAHLYGELTTSFGWKLLVDRHAEEPALRNFPLQANGAEILRLAVINAVDAGIRICAPIHDALLIEAPLTDLDEAIVATRAAMARASRTVLQDLELRTDVTVVRWPDRFRDPRGVETWDTVMAVVGSLRTHVETVKS